MKFHEIPIKTHISLHSNVYFNGKLSKMSPWVSASFYRVISGRAPASWAAQATLQRVEGNVDQALDILLSE